MKIMVIDGNSILNRAFYAIRHLSNKDGQPTNAIYGFLSTYFKLLEEEFPDRTIACFDVRAKTFRHDKFEGYKSNRKGMPDELACQLPILKDVLNAMGIKCCEQGGFEADDLLGTISTLVKEQNNECVLVTGDKDSLQLVDGKTIVKFVSTRMGQTTTKNYDSNIFYDEYGFRPINIIDLKALMGDSSDNIPGVPGVGQKTASELIKKFSTIDSVYENIEDCIIKKGVRDKLIDGKQSAYMSLCLATIINDVPIDFNPNQLPPQTINKHDLLNLFTKLEFRNFITKLELDKETHSVNQKKLTVDCDVILTKNLDSLNLYSSKIFLNCKYDLSCFAFYDLDNVYISYSDDHNFKEILSYIFSSVKDIITFGAKAIIKLLNALDISLAPIAFDVEVAAYLLEPTESTYDLDKLCFKYLGIDLNQANSQISIFDQTDNDDIAFKSIAIHKLYNIFIDKLTELNMDKLYFDIEHPLIYVLSDMETCGFKVDKNQLMQFSQCLGQELNLLTHDIYALAGEQFNINSPKQLGEILFAKLKLPHGKKTKTGYSTNVEVLEKLRSKHEIVEKIMQYRIISKLKSTYADGLLKVIEKDGRVHTCFKQTVTATGRLSSTDPNLQNIPVRTSLGSEMRKMFVANDGYILIDADYSQIELRILAHISNDKNMIDGFLSDHDIHSITAAQIMHVPLCDVTSAMRSSAKAVNFGIVYGISDFALAQDIGTSRSEAGQYIKSYLENYSGVKNYMDDIKRFAKENGYVESLFKRRRSLPEISSKNFNIRSMSERIALNTPIQASAADIIKIAMINVHNRLKKEKLKSRLVLQVHDELIIEAAIDEKDYVKALLVEEMQQVISLSVPLVVDAGEGQSWYDAKC